MIFVDRNQVAEPEILSKIKKDGKTETELAIEHYTNNWDGKTQYDFKRYKAPKVKGALETLFHGKCAYCESFFGHVSPEDIEHWRPKGAVILENGKQHKPAYYWLGATWTNLLPSCIDCNRKRKQIDVRDDDNEQSGKKNLFPVEDEAHRWTHHDQANHNDEQPLILDPCIDEPHEYLIVDPDAVIHEKEEGGTLENKRAQSSIDVFGLNRKDLVDERKKQLDIVISLCNDVKNITENLAVLPDGALKEKNLDWIKEKFAALKKHQKSKSTYQMMKRPIIEKFMRDIGPTLDNLNITYE